ncbi:unnamed protein product [Paramecium sonneborni]|uniref:Uncharacterized protein n=1 Tax=Paramecium sonneborni TaxID=65129 RepID=A0A8S1K9Z7_9CILI|nr:unnamed protein product [Paramecium sonneborni]
MIHNYSHNNQRHQFSSGPEQVLQLQQHSKQSLPIQQAPSQGIVSQHQLEQEQIYVAYIQPHYSTQAYILQSLFIIVQPEEQDPSHFQFTQFQYLVLHESKQSLSYKNYMKLQEVQKLAKFQQYILKLQGAHSIHHHKATYIDDYQINEGKFGKSCLLQYIHISWKNTN